MHFAAQDLNHLLTQYGYWAVLIFVAIESLGIPFPGETMLLAAAIYAGSTHNLNIFLVVAAAAAGAIIGDNIGYSIGREGGYRLLRRFGKFIHVREREMKLGQYLFMKHGGKVVFFGRFVSVLRTYAAFLAGVNRMRYPWFFLANAAGGILWACIYGFGGYLVGKGVSQISGTVGLVLGIAAAIVIVIFLIFLKRNFSRLADEAEQALPGPLDQYRRGATPQDISKESGKRTESQDTKTSQDGRKPHVDAARQGRQDNQANPGGAADGNQPERPTATPNTSTPT